ncbi:MAG TPA: hypothetical protein VNI84_16685 [Pyrinomonadaceae bacterium]|nr:hypothetical protein [Pyrinomonadaceae bacterium]
MKWLVILLILVLISVFVAVRYRRQIQTGIYFYRMFRKMRQMGKASEKQIDKKETANAAPLVRCARCGKWTPQTKALNLRSKIFYCSSNCLESAVKVG